MPRVTPFLWFEAKAEEAARFYVSVFPNSRMISPEAPTPEGGRQPLIVTFEIDGQKVMAMNGGPHYRLTPAFSMFVDCRDQAEVDHYWQALLAGGGTESMCGWLVDRFGLSWQVIPAALPRLIGGPDMAAAGRATQAMMQMRKIDLAALEAAYAGK